MKSSSAVATACVVLGVAALACAGYALWTNDPRNSIGMSGLIVAPFLFYLAHKARREAAGASLYTLLIKPQPASELGEWWQTGPYREVVGYSSLGVAFLRNPADRTYAVLAPFYSDGVPSAVGRFASIAEFEVRVLRDDATARRVLEPEKVAGLSRAHGLLERGHVYIPVPYPMFAATPKTWDRGDFWVFMDLVGQTHAMIGLPDGQTQG